MPLSDMMNGFLALRRMQQSEEEAQRNREFQERKFQEELAARQKAAEEDRQFKLKLANMQPQQRRFSSRNTPASSSRTNSTANRFSYSTNPAPSPYAPTDPKTTLFNSLLDGTLNDGQKKELTDKMSKVYKQPMTSTFTQMLSPDGEAELKKRIGEEEYSKLNPQQQHDLLLQILQGEAGEQAQSEAEAKSVAQAHTKAIAQAEAEAKAQKQIDEIAGRKINLSSFTEEELNRPENTAIKAAAEYTESITGRPADTSKINLRRQLEKRASEINEQIKNPAITAEEYQTLQSEFNKITNQLRVIESYKDDGTVAKANSLIYQANQAEAAGDLDTARALLQKSDELMSGIKTSPVGKIFREYEKQNAELDAQAKEILDATDKADITIPEAEATGKRKAEIFQQMNPGRFFRSVQGNIPRAENDPRTQNYRKFEEALKSGDYKRAFSMLTPEQKKAIGYNKNKVHQFRERAKQPMSAAEAKEAKRIYRNAAESSLNKTQSAYNEDYHIKYQKSDIDKLESAIAAAKAKGVNLTQNQIDNMAKQIVFENNKIFKYGKSVDGVSQDVYHRLGETLGAEYINADDNTKKAIGQRFAQKMPELDKALELLRDKDKEKKKQGLELLRKLDSDWGKQSDGKGQTIAHPFRDDIYKVETDLLNEELAEMIKVNPERIGRAWNDYLEARKKGESLEKFSKRFGVQIPTGELIPGSNYAYDVSRAKNEKPYAFQYFNGTKNPEAENYIKNIFPALQRYGQILKDLENRRIWSEELARKRSF